MLIKMKDYLAAQLAQKQLQFAFIFSFVENCPCMNIIVVLFIVFSLYLSKTDLSISYHESTS